MAVEKLYSQREVLEILGISQPTLWRMGQAGQAPKKIKVGRTVKYRESDLKAFIKSRTAT